MRKILPYLGIALLALALSGCASQTLHVEVDSIAQQNPSNKSIENYYILPEDKQKNSDDLLFQEVVGAIKPYLEQKNIAIADDISQADNIIMLDYGISAPIQNTETYMVPQRGIVGYDTHSYGNSNYNIDGNYIYGQRNSNSYTSARYGVVGYKTEQRQYTTYNRWINMTAYRLVGNPPNIGPQRWKLSLRSEGSSNDFRKVLPFIVSPLEDTLCTNTGGLAKIIVHDYELMVKLKLMDKRISVHRID